MKFIYMSLSIAALVGTTSHSVIAQQNQTADEAKGLSIGTQAPDFKAIDQNGNTFHLQEALNKGPVVLIFYRGQWCPICNRHLSTLQDSLELIYEKGASVIAISPEKPELLNKTAEKTGAAFSLIHDEGYNIATKYDVIFSPDKKQRLMYNTVLGADLKNAHSDDSQLLPIPATYVIDKDGTIAWRHFDPNYKKRSTVTAILDNL